jgi:sec-independent protein translocase protein TatC
MSKQPSDEQVLIGDGKAMPLFDHLHELRKVLVRSLLAVLILFFVAMAFSTPILEFLKIPLLNALPEGSKSLHFTGPMDVFMASLHVGLFTAVVFGAPFWTYQFWRFIEPALYPTERRYVLPFAIASIALFFAGLAFCYYVMLPMALTFLIGMGAEVGTPMITINDYLSLVSVLALSFGLVFETPVVLVLLAALHLIDAATLSKHRSMIIVVILIIAAVLTPPDPISQVSMAVPMYLMFEAAVLIIRLMERAQKKKTTKDERPC